jgi:hypothetical protein
LVVVRAGGKHIHPDVDRRSQRGADFVLGSSVIELKILEDEGLDKSERQRKLAKLFREGYPSQPTGGVQYAKATGKSLCLAIEPNRQASAGKQSTCIADPNK